MTDQPPNDSPEETTGPPEEVPPTPAEEAPEPTPLVCAKCAAPLDADQTYCLECGEPTPLAPPLRPRRRRAALATAALLAVGAGAGALAYAVASDGGSDRAPIASVGSTLPPPVATGTIGTTGTEPFPTTSIPTVGTSTSGVTTPTDTLSTDTVATETFGTDTGIGTVGTDTVGTDTIDTTGTVPGTGVDTTGAVPTEDTTTEETTEETIDETTTEETTDSGSGSSSGASDWPAGTSGWTVQVSSVRNRAGASRLVRRITAAGEEAGLIFSSDFANFKRPGYWVVFSGVFDSRAEAATRQRTLAGRFGPTIIRRIDS